MSTERRIDSVYLSKIKSIKHFDKAVRLQAELISPNSTYSSRSNSIGVLIWIKNPGDQKMNIGDHFIFSTKLKEIAQKIYPWEVDWKKINAKRAIYYECNLNSDKEYHIVLNKRRSLQKMALNFRELLSSFYDEHLKENNSAIVKAMILGDKQSLSSIQKESFSQSGVMHILAVSGMHVGIIYAILNVFLTNLFGLGKNSLIRLILISLILIAYSVITGLSTSVIRASSMIILWMLIRIGQREAHIYQILMSAAFFILLFKPDELTSLSFQLSFSAVLGIVTLFPIMNNLLSFEWKVLQFIWSFISVSTSAQLATLPLTMHYFDQFPVYYLLGNAIAIPFSGVIIIGGIGLIALSWFSPLRDLISLLLDNLLSFQSMTFELIRQLPYPVIHFYLNIMESIIFVFIISAMIYSIYINRRIIFYLSMFSVLAFTAFMIAPSNEVRLSSISTKGQTIWLQLNEADRTVMYLLTGEIQDVPINHINQFAEIEIHDLTSEMELSIHCTSSSGEVFSFERIDPPDPRKGSKYHENKYYFRDRPSHLAIVQTNGQIKLQFDDSDDWLELPRKFYKVLNVN